MTYMNNTGTTITPNTNSKMDEEPTLEIFTEELQNFVIENTWQADQDRNQTYMAQALTQPEPEPKTTTEAITSLAPSFQNLMPMQMDNKGEYDPEASLQTGIVANTNGLVKQPEPTSNFMEEVLDQLRLIRIDTMVIRQSLARDKEIPKRTKRGTKDTLQAEKKNCQRIWHYIIPRPQQCGASTKAHTTSQDHQGLLKQIPDGILTVNTKVPKRSKSECEENLKMYVNNN
jgi:hypothetical protein